MVLGILYVIQIIDVPIVHCAIVKQIISLMITLLLCLKNITNFTIVMLLS